MERLLPYHVLMLWYVNSNIPINTQALPHQTKGWYAWLRNWIHYSSGIVLPHFKAWDDLRTVVDELTGKAQAPSRVGQGSAEMVDIYGYGINKQMLLIVYEAVVRAELPAWSGPTSVNRVTKVGFHEPSRHHHTEAIQSLVREPPYKSK